MAQSGVDAWLGADPGDVVERLRAFTRSCETLSADSSLIEEYAQRWIGVYQGEVQAAADDLESLLRELDRIGVPRGDTVIRFMETDQPTLIL